MYIHGYCFMLHIFKTQFTQLLYATYFRNISYIKVNPFWKRMMIKLIFYWTMCQSLLILFNTII